MINLKRKLQKLKNDLEGLKIEHHTHETQSHLDDIDSELRMIIRRIYPEYEKVLYELLPCTYNHCEDSSIYYKGRIDEMIRAINTILSEKELFKLKDFAPIKRTTTWGAGLKLKILHLFIRKEKEY